MTNQDSNNEYRRIAIITLVIVVGLLLAMFIGMAISDSIYHSKQK